MKLKLDLGASSHNTRALAVFNRLWQENYMTRDEAYDWLASRLMLSPNQCHIYRFNKAECLNVVQYSRQKLSELEHAKS
jgi:hypothetical protein